MKVDPGSEQNKYRTESAGKIMSQYHSEGVMKESGGTSRKAALTVKGEVGKQYKTVSQQLF